MKKIGLLLKGFVTLALTGLLFASCAGGISDPVDLQSFIDASGSTVNLSDGEFVLNENESIVINGAQSITGGDSKFDMKGAVITVKAAGVNLSNLTNVSEIIVASEVGDGDFTLNGSDVTKLTVNGGGANSVHINNAVVASVSVSKEGVRIVLEGATTVAALEIKANCALDKGEGSTAVVASLTIADSVTEIEFKATITITNVEKIPATVTIEAPEGVTVPESVTTAKEKAAAGDEEKNDTDSSDSNPEPEPEQNTYFMNYDSDQSENCAVSIPLPGNPKYKKGDYVHVHVTGTASNNLPVLRFSLTQGAESFGWARLTNELRKDVSIVKDTPFSIDYNFKVVKDYYTDEDAVSNLYLCYESGVVGYVGNQQTVLTNVEVTCEKLTTVPSPEPFPTNLYFGADHWDDGTVCYTYYFDETKGKYFVSSGETYKVVFSGTPDRDVDDVWMDISIVQNNSNGDDWGGFGASANHGDSYSFTKDKPFEREFYLIIEDGRNQNIDDDYYSYISVNAFKPFVLKDYNITLTKVDTSLYSGDPSAENKFAIKKTIIGTHSYRGAKVNDECVIKWNPDVDYQDLGWRLSNFDMSEYTGVRITVPSQKDQKLEVKIRPFNNPNGKEASFPVPFDGVCTAWFNGFGKNYGDISGVSWKDGMDIYLAANGFNHTDTQVLKVELLTETAPVCPDDLKWNGVEFGSQSYDVHLSGGTVTWLKGSTDGGCGWNLSGIDFSDYKKVRVYVSSNNAENLSLNIWDSDWQNGCAYGSSVQTHLQEQEPYLEASLLCDDYTWSNKEQISIDLSKGIIVYLQSPLGEPRSTDQTTVVTKIEFLTE